jgi:hypothetical protein
MLLLQRKCPITRALNTMEIPLTEQEYATCMDTRKAGAPMQVAFPTLNDQQCEFIKTGITPEICAAVLGEE